MARGKFHDTFGREKKQRKVSRRISAGWLSSDIVQGVLTVTNLRGQTEPKRRFSLTFAGSRLSFKTQRFGNADFRRKPQTLAGNRRKAQEPTESRRLAFVPLGSSP